MRRACGAQSRWQPCRGRLLAASTVVPIKVVSEMLGHVVLGAALTFSRWDYSGFTATATSDDRDGRLGS
jgi:hypothetical protein